MPSVGWVILIGSEAWRVGCCRDGASLELSEVVQSHSQDDEATHALPAVIGRLRELGYAGEPTLLATPSNWHLCATLDRKALPPKPTDESLAYQLEERLPLPAEQTVTDFVSSNGCLLGVSAPLAMLQPVADVFEKAGVFVAHICPAALLALQTATRRKPLEADICLWVDDQGLNVFGCCEDGPTEWHLIPGEAEDLKVCLGLRALRGNTSLRVTACDLPPALEQSLSSLNQVQVVPREPQKMIEAAAEGAAGVLAGALQPWVNLRRGRLAAPLPYQQLHGPMKTAVVAALVFVCILCAGWLWRAQRYGQVAVQAEARQREIFQQVLPNQAVPVNIPARLESAVQELRSLRGRSQDLPAQTSGLVLLHHILSHLPADLRFRILELRLDGSGRIYLEGQARSHGDAEAIAASLRRSGGLQIDPPRTEKLATEGVSFTLTGTLAGSPTNTGGSTP